MAKYDTQIQFAMHSPFRRTRDRTIAALMEATQDTGSADWDAEQAHADKTAAKLCNCGRHAAIFQDPKDGHLIQSQARCKNRLCPRCNSIRSAQLQQNIESHLSRLNSPRMLTLTLDHSQNPLKEQIKHLYESFKRLRRSKQYKAKITGGVAVCEITHNNATGEWHPHLHVLVDGEYWKHEAIKNAWEIASQGSTIVDIKMIHDRSKAGRYVAKYVAKIGDVDGIPASKIPELAVALHGLRMVQTSGTLYGSTNNEKAEPREQSLEYVAPYGPLVEAANSGSDSAQRVFNEVHQAINFHRAPDSDQLTPQDELASRKASLLLWDWWSEQTKAKHNEPTRKPKNKKRKRSASDGTQRLWQEPKPTADALAAGM